MSRHRFKEIRTLLELARKAGAFTTAALTAQNAPLILLTAVALTVALFFFGVILPAVWSKKEERRRSAHEMAKLILSQVRRRR